MRLTILVDNQASHKLRGEWGLSILIEADGRKILLDTGASALFQENAARLHLPLSDLDYLVLSHGHWDHTWGLPGLIQTYLADQIPIDRRPRLIAHPLVTAPKLRDNGSEFGVWFSKTALTRHFRTNFTSAPQWLTPNLLYLGEITRRNFFENQQPLGKTIQHETLIADFLTEDTALAYRSPDGLIIITGCSHSGICNIIDQARELCREARIVDIVGGFHLLNTDPARLKATIAYFKNLNPRQIHPGHCTDFASRAALAQVVPVKEISVGLQLDYE
jgi:7,8-dihydropterin-6-yl-methyl-4-(beta-D-ribofuranosyl)aminobenzene 5'-phosphate synthase